MQVGDSKAPILLVEGDSVDELRAVRAYTETGHTNRLLVARTTEHAMTLLKACAKGLRFGLVLVDLYAPRFGAADLIKRIRKESSLREVPVVVLAPDRERDEQVTAASLQANAWVKRPTNHVEFCRLIDKLLEVFLGVKSKKACQETK